MWTEVWDEIRQRIAATPLLFWLVLLFSAVWIAQVVSLWAALRERRRWCAVYRAACNGERAMVEQATLPRSRLQATLGSACLLIPAGAFLSTTLARRAVTTMLLGGHLAYDSMHAAVLRDGLDGQLGALLLASLFAVPSVLLAAVAWGMMVGLRQRARKLQAADGVPTVLPRPWRSAVTALATVVLGIVPLLAGVVVYVGRYIAGTRAASGIDPSEQLHAMDGTLAHARRGMEAGWLAEAVGALIAALLVTWVLVRQRKLERLTWRRTLLWSIACLAGAAACLVATHPLQAENDMAWPPFQGNPCRCSCGGFIGCPPQSEVEGPDALERASLLELSESSMKLDGRQISSTAELTEELVVAKNNHGLLHPGEPFPGRIAVSCAPAVPAAPLADALAAASRAGYREVRFRLTTVETIRRPLLGSISRLKSTEARASFVGHEPATVVSLRGAAAATYGAVVRQVVGLRHAGHEVRLHGADEEN
jgi:hypothetical protein